MLPVAVAGLALALVNTSLYDLRNFLVGRTASSLEAASSCGASLTCKKDDDGKKARRRGRGCQFNTSLSKSLDLCCVRKKAHLNTFCLVDLIGIVRTVIGKHLLGSADIPDLYQHVSVN